MTATYEAQVETALDELMGIVGAHGIERQDAVLAGIAHVIAFSKCVLTHRLTKDSTVADVVATPLPEAGTIGHRLVCGIVQTAGCCFVKDENVGIDAAVMIDEIGYLILAARLANTPERRSALEKVANRIGVALKTIKVMSDRIVRDHQAQVLLRDLEIGIEDRVHVDDTCQWVLCTHLNGSTTRAQAILRRRQALEAYGNVSSLLRKDAITRAIDAGQPLSPLLCAVLEIDAASLRRIRGTRDLKKSLGKSDNLRAIRQALAYGVPSHRWPTDWSSSGWAKQYGMPILSPEITDGKTEVHDAVSAFRMDVMRPLANSRAIELGYDLRSDDKARSFVQAFDLPLEFRDHMIRRRFHAAMTKAIVGTRKTKSFQEGVALWHRRAACAAALRHESITQEGNAEDPSWPAICPVWTSEDGLYKAVPLTTASELIEEGNVHNHCVGGYYENCRTGKTHIISMRHEDEPVGTLELLATFDKGRLSNLTPGQFESTDRSRPPDDVQDAPQAFLADLGERRHPHNSKEVAAFAKKMQDHYSQVGDQTLSMEHAERTWKLYRAFLPRPVPDTPMEWAVTSGFLDIVDAVLETISGPAPNKVERMQMKDAA